MTRAFGDHGKRTRWPLVRRALHTGPGGEQGFVLAAHGHPDLPGVRGVGQQRADEEDPFDLVRRGGGSDLGTEAAPAQ